MESMTHNTGTVTVQVITKETENPPRHPNDVDFEVKYPKGYDGLKYMPEGITVVSKEAAEEFTKRGIGHIVVETKVDEQKEPEPVETKKNTTTSKNPVKTK